jgi:hypothetical protein
VVKRIDLTTNLPAGRQGITKENSKPARLTPVGRVSQRKNKKGNLVVLKSTNLKVRFQILKR